MSVSGLSGALHGFAIVAIAVVLLTLTATATAQPAGGCKAFGGTRADGTPLWCSGYVQWQIPSNWSTADEDVFAQADARISGACPYYAQKDFQCAKYFPVCEGNNTVGTVTLLCYSVCDDAKKQCNPTNFQSNFFSNECGETQYIASSTLLAPACRDVDLLGSSSANTWKWALVGILSAVGGIIVLSFAYSRIRQCVFARQLAKEDAEDREHNANVRRRSEMGGPAIGARPDPHAQAAVGGQVGATVVADMPPIELSTADDRI